jgi:hypothetical protein
MPSAGRVKVSIRDEETKTHLEEYQIIADERKTECWIESKEASQFSIEVSITPNDVRDLYAFRCRLHVDGQHVSGGLLGQVNERFYPRELWEGLQETENVLKPFTFAKTRFMGIVFQ